MQGKTKKSQLMASWGKKWGKDAGLKRKVGGIVGSANKEPQVKHLASEYSNLSRSQAEKKMREMKFSPIERKRFIETNDELSRVFGIKKDGDKPLTKTEKRRLLKKEEMHKKFNIRSSREDISSNIQEGKKNPLWRIHKEGENSINADLHSKEGDHKVTALAEAGKNADSVASVNSADSPVGNSGATGLTGGGGGGIAKGGRPIGL